MEDPVKCVCGHKPIIRRAKCRSEYLFVLCFKCGRHSEVFLRKDNAVEAWNNQIDEEKHKILC